VTAGLNADAVTLNRTMGQAVAALAQALDQCAAINVMLNNSNRGFTSAGLLALGFVQADVTNIQEAFAALALLQQIAYGQAAGVAVANNYFFQAQLLLGTTPL
jgi:hypothetical protein